MLSGSREGGVNLITFPFFFPSFNSHSQSQSPLITKMHLSASSSDMLASSLHPDDIDRHHVMLSDENSYTIFFFRLSPHLFSGTDVIIGGREEQSTDSVSFIPLRF